MNLLDNIDSPADLKLLTQEQLEALAEEIRIHILRCVSRTGGHLASNLGIVELTLALHAVLECPGDKIVFDVGHQSYVHKILTGRRDQMHTLRAKDGLSGFPKPQESSCDAFATGHASTSLSAALGMARARDLKGEDFHIAAVVGDGAFGGGMIYEAISDMGSGDNKLMIILNDNNMSISPNVGALSKALSNLRQSPRYRGFKLWAKERLSEGGYLARLMHRVKTSIKYLMVPGSLFEEMGLFYIGPVDGHDIGALMQAFTQAKKAPMTCLVHVITHKGQGYRAAEADPSTYHGVSAFSIRTGMPKAAAPEKLPFAAALGRALVKRAREDERIVAVTAAMPDATGLGLFRDTFPRRFFDVGIAEEHAVTMAAGLAAGGMRPVVPIYSTFLQRAYDQIVHDVCLQHLPVIFAVDHAGIVGEDGETHQGVFDISYMRHIPNLTILSPASSEEMADALDYALDMASAVAIRYPRGCDRLNGLGDMPPLSREPWPLLRRGKDLSILAVGAMAQHALEAAEALKGEMDIAVYSVRIIKPLDEEILKRATDYKLCVTLEDNAAAGGFGSLVLETLEKLDIRRSVRILAVPDRFIAHATRAQCLGDLALAGDALARRIRALWERQS
ncbi:MAG: 1-deoxy-D-xylulose-5-phosphate synthase [Christensenellales bacterium]|jgi:1-deoxy-D-xylulose-5-phosphate synthase